MSNVNEKTASIEIELAPHVANRQTRLGVVAQAIPQLCIYLTSQMMRDNPHEADRMRVGFVGTRHRREAINFTAEIMDLPPNVRVEVARHVQREMLKRDGAGAQNRRVFFPVMFPESAELNTPTSEAESTLEAADPEDATGDELGAQAAATLGDPDESDEY
ncbi:hypothetical protein [Roseimaritima ulvae]|uniref:Uncharacterized protein n=1 Tax=Roseimaritima ulvae TaxID=980254 RepID=A0A5B9QTM1_9BACT|nr:hypothetical protein [Roseimaritima ulvae]QEG40426.1 hypothetical protein UC8_24380 [Roseimaritima ulvae]